MQFKDVIGHTEIKKNLISSVKENRIAHAQLFMGSEGCGNLALARAYVQYVFCKSKTENDSCGSCSACTKAAKLIHPDLHFSFPIALSKDVRNSFAAIADWREALAENPYLNLIQWMAFFGENKQGVIPVEESADIMRKLSLTSFDGGYKVMIIWLPEKMNLATANKLLKILEEPPDKTLFLLVTENAELLLPTIISRTQLVKVNRITDEEMKQVLMNKHSLSESEAARLVYFADGNYNEVQNLLSSSETEDFNFVQFRIWMRLCFAKDVQKIQQWVELIATSGREKHKIFFAYGLNIVREALMMNFGDDNLVRLQGEEMEFVKKFAPYIHGENCTQITEEFNKSIQHVERNANAKILFTDLSLKMMALLKLPVVASELKV